MTCASTKIRAALKALLAIAVIASFAQVAFAEEEKADGKAVVEHKKTIFGTEKTKVKRKSKKKAADGSEITHEQESETKVHRNGKTETEATDKVEVTPPADK